MIRLCALGIAALTCPLVAQSPLPRAAAESRRVEATETAPEKLLSPTTQLYLRWDGIAAHNEAYKKSVWGGLMAGSTGDSIRALLAKLPKQLGNSFLSAPLLEGSPPEELKANLEDIKSASKLVDLLAQKGAIFAAEVREPTPTLRGVGSALGGLLNGKLPGPEVLAPNVHMVAIVPDVGDRAESFHAAMRLATKKMEFAIEPFAVAGRSGFQLAFNEKAPIPLRVAWWVEGKHFMVYAGNGRPEAFVGEITANAAKGGISRHPLYLRCLENPGYESIARGFVDTGRVVTIAKNLAGPFVPGLSQRLDDIGLGNLKAIAFNSGFEGKESRATYDFELSGERKGLTKVLKQEPLALKDLPPLPPDVNRFAAMRVDPSAAYDAAIIALETLMIEETFDVEEGVKSPADKIRLRREHVAKIYDNALGVNLKEDLIPHLGDRVVLFQSPTEGLSILGTVLCVSLKDPAKVKAVAERIQRGLDSLVGAPLKVRRKTIRGIETRELYSREFGFLTPTYGIVGDWLVISLYPQGVQGFVLRSKGEIPSWKPDLETAARLAKLPADSCGLQYCDPRSSAQNFCCLGPLLLGTLGLRNRGNDAESDFEPIDIGLIPNAHELSKHLFPNLTATRNDARGIRIEVNESFSLPLEVVGLEALTFLGVLGLFSG